VRAPLLQRDASAFERRWFAITRRAVAHSHTRAASPSGTSSSRRQVRQEDVSKRILRIARRAGSPAAVRDYVRTVRAEEFVEPPPSLMQTPMSSMTGIVRSEGAFV
jgi:hypothetical protein